MSAKRQPEAPKEKEYVALPAPCECGKPHGARLDHYQLLRASCGRIFWALQKRRNGPLKLFPWPGHNLSRAEMIEKYGPEKEA